MNSSTPSEILKFANISKKYSEKYVLKSISVTVSQGDCLAVLGPNGAGKSTLLKLLSQQTKPTSGEIYYYDKSIKEIGADYRKRIGVISHQPFLYDGLSALDNLVFYASLYDVPNPEERAKTLLKRVNMHRFMHDPVRNYSRGMLQRTCIARALLQDPEIVFLDEPYTGLDRQATYMLTDILKEQIEMKTTLVLVTHDLQLGYDLASQVLILAKGQQVLYTDKSKLKGDFEELYLSLVDDVDTRKGGTQLKSSSPEPLQSESVSPRSLMSTTPKPTSSCADEGKIEGKGKGKVVADD